MKFVVMGTGSAGDLVPCLRLAGALTEKGHQATVIALADYAPQRRSHVEQHHSRVDVHTIAGGEDALWPGHPLLRQAMLTNPGATYLALRRKLAQLTPRVNDALLDLVDSDTVLVSNSVTMAAGRLLTCARGARHATILFAPLLPTTSSASCMFVPRRVGNSIGAAIAHVMWALTRELGGAYAEDMRCRLRTPDTTGPDTTGPDTTGPDTTGPDTTGPDTTAPDPTGPDGTTVLMATSPFVCPPSRRWPATVVQTGWFRSEPAEGSSLPSSLRHFLGRHPEPLLMSFGSVLVRDADADLALFQAATAPDRGLIVQSRALPPGPWGEGAYNALDVDHSLLLPHVSAVVHHGGAGTTYAALAAGKPALVVPHLGDQPYYGRRVHALEAGPPPIPRYRLCASGLRSAVRRLDDPAYAAGAIATQQALDQEDGLARAVKALEQI